MAARGKAQPRGKEAASLHERADLQGDRRADAGELLVVSRQHFLVPMFDDAYEKVALIGETAVDASLDNARPFGDVRTEGRRRNARLRRKCRPPDSSPPNRLADGSEGQAREDLV